MKMQHNEAKYPKQLKSTGKYTTTMMIFIILI